MRNKKKRLINVPYVDLSYKWAGGGVMSNVKDLIKFGNLMLDWYQTDESNSKLILCALKLKTGSIQTSRRTQQLFFQEHYGSKQYSV